jgi:hypothetical protein
MLDARTKRPPENRRCSPILEEVSSFWIPLSPVATNLPTADSPARNSSDPDTEGSTEESEASSPSQSLQTFPQKGEVDGEIPAPPFLTHP